MWSDLLISLLVVIPGYNREHLGRHCMDIIECVVFLLRPLHQIPLLFSGGHTEIRLNDACRAGVPAFRVQKSAFMIFPCLVPGSCIDRVSRIDFLQFRFLMAGFLLFRFLFPSVLLFRALLEIMLYYSKLC